MSDSSPVTVPGFDALQFTFAWHHLPRMSDHPGIGGAIRGAPSHFEVTEIPAYEPSGSGEHLYLLVQKTGVSTPELIAHLTHFGVPTGDIGVAGLKDKHAVTTQWISIPKRYHSAVGEVVNVPGVSVLDASYHTNKLATGHLLGNRFTIRIHGVQAGAERVARTTLANLARHGIPNYFGPQRFGAFGRNAYDGLAVVNGIYVPGNERMQRFFVTALQSFVYNRVLAKRVHANLLGSVVHGDVAKKHDTGGEFTVEHAAAEQPRAASGEISATVPLYGARVPVSGGEAGVFERAVLRELGLEHAWFTKRPGDRRFARVFPTETAVHTARNDVVVQFVLPKGSFATTVIREITGTPVDEPPAG